MSKVFTVALVCATLGTLAPTVSQAGEQLDRIKQNDKIVCIVNPNSPGFSVPDSQGVFQGFNTDFCRMAAGVIFGDVNKVEIRGVGFSDSLKTMIAGDADMASRSITQTATRAAEPNLGFVVTTFYDGQGFMVPKSLNVNSARELAGATICAEDGTTTLQSLADYFGRLNVQYTVQNIADKSARLQAFFSGKCDALSTDLSALASDRQLAPNPDDYVILPEVISNEPLTLVARPDKELQEAIFWGVQAMLNAEELGITSQNIDQVMSQLDSAPPKVKRLLSQNEAAGDVAKKLGISPNWSYVVIKNLGNYGEVFERHLGKGSALAMDRATSPNRLAIDGGLLYAYPIR
ncbi:MAG: transporter substrate-binding domain-containing protein [Burkholderiaceae bacterium]|nr:transporter substrate-binding domain-containing protein [Burkholderiaceae bacterium]MCD8517783.1 transporter substrate-binding domain-containing protein [Burkholderiaceae bacterium]MCD8537464.1 transporter substrate-binding domain-containing protein [Burkholderiaceae bacterium]MCD8564206.1 transporter substrate-binding domain-containing protein [Burkholderiaceae bacterium]